MKICTSCNKQVIGQFVEFPNPANPKMKVIRCIHCRESAKTYTVEGFVGP